VIIKEKSPIITPKLSKDKLKLLKNMETESKGRARKQTTCVDFLQGEDAVPATTVDGKGTTGESQEGLPGVTDEAAAGKVSNKEGDALSPTESSKPELGGDAAGPTGATEGGANSGGESVTDDARDSPKAPAPAVVVEEEEKEDEPGTLFPVRALMYSAGSLGTFYVAFEVRVKDCRLFRIIHCIFASPMFFNLVSLSPNWKPTS
jgi:hypothetical protein